MLLLALSLTRGEVYNLQLLVCLASAFFLRFEFHGIHNCMLLSQTGDSLHLNSQVPIFISDRNRAATYRLSAAAYSIYLQLSSSAGGCPFHLHPEDVPCCGDKGTHLTW
jgi:hypothetical protein